VGLCVDGLQTRRGRGQLRSAAHSRRRRDLLWRVGRRSGTSWRRWRRWGWTWRRRARPRACRPPSRATGSHCRTCDTAAKSKGSTSLRSGEPMVTTRPAGRAAGREPQHPASLTTVTRRVSRKAFPSPHRAVWCETIHRAASTLKGLLSAVQDLMKDIETTFG
jgi:hypothetical protein